jgi:hypothetical protein
MNYVIVVVDDKHAVHTESCYNNIVITEKARADFRAKWPKSCLKCQATGWISWTENGAPFGEGYWPMPMTDICPDCIEKGICPRCGFTGSLNEEGTECCDCGWTSETTDPMPDEPACSCDGRTPSAHELIR